ncbi:MULTISPECIES: peroxide stress protein YaaA [Modicisalibacter]|uniref:peroxide stress protein YaaA n=1 Tax=Modicisalibacter TaxID=574347 RepID=UPI00100B1648|nr:MULTISPECIES: peroxide stress protein YaaA [Halomonadaceae]MBZ9558247.1 peroxide stress protein YaaA [Modicisalibacter sp. R2A 31.J]MBZ9573085.1 peroxide stress protein YaaA [Modicisalibacter sp. MOD 31.J]
MLSVISPAKTLDFETPPTTEQYSQPDYLDQSRELIDILRDYSPQRLAELMGISDKLAGLNAARYGQWQPPFTLDNAKQAAQAFQGDVYQGLDAPTFDDDDNAFAQAHLRILSGLYGLLRPLDLIQPYRLEMGTRLANPAGKDLYAFWRERLTRDLDAAVAASGSPVLVNLASNEYVKAIDTRRLSARVISPVFKDAKNGQYKIISFYAKKARGLMAAWLIRERIDDPAALTGFDVAGYRYAPEQSKEHAPVFVREEADRA